MISSGEEQRRSQDGYGHLTRDDVDNNLDRELDQLKMSQGMLGQTSQQVAEQVILSKNKQLF